MKNIQTYVYSKRPYGDASRLNLDWNEADECVAINKNDIIDVLTNSDIHLYGEYIPAKLVKLTTEYYSVNREHFIPVPGSDYGIESILRILMQKGDRVYIESLGYKHFEVFARNLGADIKRLSLAEMFELKDEKAIIYLVNPNNPTGISQSVKRIERLIEGNQASIVIIDEAYIEFAQNTSSIVDLVEMYQNVLVLRTFSKAFGMAGIKFGYIFGSATPIEIIKSQINQKSIPSIVMALACRALENRKNVAEYVAEVTATKRYISERYKWNIESDANFFTMLIKDRTVLQQAEAHFNIGTRSLAETYGVHEASRVTLPGKKNRDRFIRFLDYIIQAKAVDGVFKYE
jgi:histidinol-phosphate aminotransferase